MSLVQRNVKDTYYILSARHHHVGVPRSPLLSASIVFVMLVTIIERDSSSRLHTIPNKIGRHTCPISCQSPERKVHHK